MQFFKLNNNKWRHNDVIAKNNGKIRTFAEPNKLYIIRKVRELLSNFAFLGCPLKKYGHVK